MAILDKNVLKARIRQKLQEKILAASKTKEDYSIGGFLGNVKSEAGGIVRGIGSLLGMAGKAIIHPIETAEFVTSPEFPKALKQIGGAIVESYKGYKQPLKKFYEEPIGVVTDALTVATFGGAGLIKLGTAAKIPEITKAGEILTKVSKPITLTKELATTGISKIPGGPEFLTALEQRGKTIETLSKAQQAHLIERNKLLTEVDDVIKVLTPEEKQTLIPFAEKRITLPFEPSENFNKAVNLVDKLAKQREALIGPEGLGKLTTEQIEARKWQPVLKQLYGDEAVSLGAKAPAVAKDLQPLAQEARKGIPVRRFEYGEARFPAGAQDKFEPKGTYYAFHPSKDIIPELPRGAKSVKLSDVKFENPLIVPFENWKANVSKQFDGLKGESLSREIGKTYDGIITVVDGKPHEIVSLKGFAKIPTAKAITSQLEPPTIPKSLEPLAIEARKYKSAEEFVKAQEEIGRARYKVAATKMSEASEVGDNAKFLEAQKEMTDANKLFRGQDTNSQLTDFYNQATKGVSEITPLTTAEKIAEAKKLLKFSDDPIYVQHIFEDKPKKFTDFFINTAPVKNFKPGFLKKSFGVKGYSIDPDSVLKWEVAQTLKYKNNVDLLERIKNLDFVEPLDNIKNLKPGYKVFAPDGYIRFYQGTIDLVKEFTSKMRPKKGYGEVFDLWDDLKDAIDSSLLEKKYIGVTSKVKLYQVPEASAKVLQAYAKATNPYVRLFWDKPVDAFRFLALALTPRWLVNNVVGNTIFSIIAGDPFSPSGYLTYRTAKAEGLIPDEIFSGFYRTEKLMTGKLGKAAETKLGALLKASGEAISEAPVIKQLKQIGNASYKINAEVDDFFRGAHFINISTREARKKILQETGEKLNSTIELLKYAKQDPEILTKAINSVEDFFYGASKLSPFERQYVRRFLPFYSWYKFIGLYSLRLPLNHPVRFEVIANLAKTFYNLTGQNELPSYLKGSVPIGETKEGDIYYLRTSGLNPFGLLEDIATQGVSQTTLSSLTPGVKTGVERLTGREAFTGKTFSSKDIIETYNGRLYKFNQQTGNVEEVEGKQKPSILEHLLRNFIPQYQLMEQAIIGGSQQYTAKGLPSLITGEGIKKSSITGEPKKPTGASQKLKLRALGLLGIPVSLRTAEQQQIEQEGLQRATTQIIGQELPFMSSQFKRRLKDELKQKILNDINQSSILEGIY